MWKKRFKIICGKPDNINQDMRVLLKKKLLQKIILNKPVLIVNRCISIQMLTTLIPFFAILFKHYQTIWQLAIASASIISVIDRGAMLEQKELIFTLNTCVSFY